MKAILACVLSLVCLTASADIVAPTRTTTYDWQCQSADGAKISDHQRFDTAFIACLNAPAGTFVQGGRYKITRTVVTAGSATLSWIEPTKNTDGSALADLSGYRIVYGTSPQALTQAVQVGKVDSYVLTGLAAGTWYFAVIALTPTAQSDPSNVATKTIT